MPISSRQLGDDEEVLVDMRPHWLFFLGPAVVTAVVVIAVLVVTVQVNVTQPYARDALVVVAVIPALWLLGRIVRWLTTSIVVTNSRLIYRTGILSRDLVQVRMLRIDEVRFRQSLLQRMLRTGQLLIDVQGEDSDLVLVDVRSPAALQRVINRQLDLLTGGRRGDPGPPIQPAGVDNVTPPRGVNVTAAASSPAAASIPDQIIQLDELRRRGIISDAEFQAKKAVLLDRL